MTTLPITVKTANFTTPRDFEKVPIDTTHVRMSGMLTRGVYDALLARAPNLRTIELPQSCLRILPPRTIALTQERGIELVVKKPELTSHTPQRSALFYQRKHYLETMDTTSQQRLALLLKKNVVAAHLLVAHFGLDGSEPVSQKNLLARYPNFKSQFRMCLEISAIFLCLNPAQHANKNVRRRALKIYTAYLAENELRPFRRQLRRLAQKLNK